MPDGSKAYQRGRLAAARDWDDFIQYEDEADDLKLDDLIAALYEDGWLNTYDEARDYADGYVAVIRSKREPVQFTLLEGGNEGAEDEAE